MVKPYNFKYTRSRGGQERRQRCVVKPYNFWLTLDEFNTPPADATVALKREGWITTCVYQSKCGVPVVWFFGEADKDPLDIAVNLADTVERLGLGTVVLWVLPSKGECEMPIEHLREIVKNTSAIGDAP
jgi:hypothetical protein